MHILSCVEKHVAYPCVHCTWSPESDFSNHHSLLFHLVYIKAYLFEQNKSSMTCLVLLVSLQWGFPMSTFQGYNHRQNTVPIEPVRGCLRIIPNPHVCAVTLKCCSIHPFVPTKFYF